MAIPIGKKCAVINCNHPAISRGLCGMHYKRQQRHGDTSDTHSKLVQGAKRQEHPLYSTWRTITRLSNGTAVCKEWLDINEFIQDVEGKPADGKYQFVRIDTTKPHSKENSYWKLIDSDVEERGKDAERMRKYSAKMREQNPDYFWGAELKKKYGITVEGYKIMVAQQNGVCAICSQPEKRVDHRNKKISRLAVDHCHATNRVRALLCHKCNAILGQAGDSIDLLEKCITYLKLHEK